MNYDDYKNHNEHWPTPPKQLLHASTLDVEAYNIEYNRYIVACNNVTYQREKINKELDAKFKRDVLEDTGLIYHYKFHKIYDMALKYCSDYGDKHEAIHNFLKEFAECLL